MRALELVFHAWNTVFKAVFLLFFCVLFLLEWMRNKTACHREITTSAHQSFLFDVTIVAECCPREYIAICCVERGRGSESLLFLVQRLHHACHSSQLFCIGLKVEMNNGGITETARLDVQRVDLSNWRIVLADKTSWNTSCAVVEWHHNRFKL